MTTYLVAPTFSELGNCEICGCKLQKPGHYEGNLDDGSIWLTPWHDCGGHCTVCMAHAGDPECIAALEEWIQITKASA